jgi:hypothetical protein
MPANFMIVQPYTEKSNRLQNGHHRLGACTVDDALRQLERLAERLHGFKLPGDVMEMLVVDDERWPVRRGH